MDCSYRATSMRLRTFGEIQTRDICAAREDGQRDLRRERPGAVIAVEQAVQIGMRIAIDSGQRNAGKERGARGADIGVAGLQSVLGGAHVRAALEQFGGQSRWQLLREKSARPMARSPASNSGAQRLAHEQRQCVAILLHAARVGGDVHLGRAQRRSPA